LSKSLRRAAAALVPACLALGCGGGGEPAKFEDNAALSKPRPGMEAMKAQMLDAFKKANRDPSRQAPNLVK
jgi:hypothetical protein